MTTDRKSDALEVECARILARSSEIVAEIAYHQRRAAHDPSAFLQVRMLRQEFKALRLRSQRYHEVLRDEAVVRAQTRNECSPSDDR
ncbi:MAG: hypothetical protein IPK13_15740 [Deltaproteobacteria bacterium]|nr:hypothetical protein [Deltaproteobacteria bacterium]